MDITYSYTAAFEDGHLVEMLRTEPDCDKSLTTETGSRFTDVQKYQETSKLISFVIHDDNESIGVDLRDGHFEINGRAIWLHRPDLENYKDFRVIYLRTIQRHFNVQMEEVSAGETCTTVGWQVTHNGENIKRTITV